MNEVQHTTMHWEPLAQVPFTPGPWELDTGEDGAIIHADVTIASIPLDATAWEANARLIAAAPDLLVALKQACVLLKQYGFNLEHTIMEQAIIKAEGASHAS